MRKFLLLLLLILMPTAVSANGGDQRVVENKYFINLSRAPFTPRVGVKTSFLISFVNIEKNKLITEDLIVKIRVAKHGGTGSTKRTFIFEQDNITVKGGVLEWPYTFNESGLHEIFFDFAFASNPQKVYEVPDFLIDVQKSSNADNRSKFFFAGLILGGVGGFLLNRLKIFGKK